MDSSSHTRTPSSSASNSTSAPTPWDVFLSYRGVDTRYTFTDHLYNALDRSGIRTFRDDPELRKRQGISDSLRQTIHESKMYIVVFSKNYASSRRCLDELVEILSCHKTLDKSVIVVFYKVDPSTVQNQTGRFKKSFQKHQIRFHVDRLAKWRATLRSVGNFSGYQVGKNMFEADIINEVVDRISLEVKPKMLDVAEYPVGLESRVKVITALFSSGTEGVIRIGIHGMGGVGKTTLAKAVYNNSYHGFQGSCFLADVREVLRTGEGMVCLQQQLINDVLKCKNTNIDNVDQGYELIRARICSIRVLIVIDDLDDPTLLEFIEGPFALGSTIIITSRNEDLLESINVDVKYKVDELSDDDSRQLFSQHAFGKNMISEAFMDLSEEILECAGGLPLALVVFGANLRYQREKGLMYIDYLKRDSIDKVEKKLLISFDALKLVDPMLQDIFLDIACFFIGWETKEVFKIMGTGYTFIRHKINILKKRCLLKINYRDELWMHDLLRDMGRKIACNNSPNKQGKYSKLWVSRDICDVLKKQEGTQLVEDIIPDKFHYPNSLEGVLYVMDAFKRMSVLRFLYLNKVNFSESFKQTFESLRWLYWDCCPLKCLPSECNLVILELPHLNIKMMWDLNMASHAFENLKTLNMPYSQVLATTPDFTKLPCLEFLNLQGCKSLEEVHISIGNLARLVSLDLRGCVKLKCLPDTICNLRALEVLNLEKCSSLQALPMTIGNIKSLRVLTADMKAISQLPNLIVYLYLNKVNFSKSFKQLFQSLRGLYRDYYPLKCLRADFLPQHLGIRKSPHVNIKTMWDLNVASHAFENLKTLNMPYSKDLVKTPDFTKSPCLQSLNLHGCKSLEEVHISVGNLARLVSLDLRGCVKLRSLPDTICNLGALEVLNLDKRRSFPMTFMNLKYVTVNYTTISQLLRKLASLKELSGLSLPTRLEVTKREMHMYRPICKHRGYNFE